MATLCVKAGPQVRRTIAVPRSLIRPALAFRLTAVPRYQHYSPSMGTHHAASQLQEHASEAARLIRGARYLTAFAGAGLSVESGIPPFRGEGGLWSRYDPRMLELDYFLAHPDTAWPVIREIFYGHFGRAWPNKAHEVLAHLGTEGRPQEAASGGRSRLQCLITQNIDSVQ
ncbi:MAG: Sir2 family NAD-dependent protein deacetylase [Spirochaetia bacterium]